MQRSLRAQDPTILYAKATLDGIISVILTANLGIGVAFSAFSVFIYQGCLTLLAAFLQTVMTEAVLNEITACGGVLITAIGINMLKIENIGNTHFESAACNIYCLAAGIHIYLKRR